MFPSPRIRSKLAFALLIPLVALVASSSMVIAAANRRAQDASARAAVVTDQVALATAALGPTGIVKALTDERTAESIVILGLDPGQFANLPQAATRATTDRAVEQFRAAIAAKPRTVQDVYRQAVDGLAQLKDIRAAADASTERGMATTVGTRTFDRYLELVAAVFDANSRTAQAVDDGDLRAGVQFIDALTRYVDLTSLYGRAVGGSSAVISGRPLTADPANLVAATSADRLAATLRSELERNDHPGYAGLTRELFTKPAVLAAAAAREAAIGGAPVDVNSLRDDVALTAAAAYDETIKRGAARLQADADRIRGAAQSEASDAESQARLVVGITSAVLVLAVVVTVVASRSITGPLSRLVGAAEEMATRTLPRTVRQILDAPMGQDVVVPDLTEISERGGFEIAEVASALNTVQRSAADLAVEQAVLRRNIADAFVNLGRRNQSLLSRLLDNITEMERNESDPDQLRQLFGLDHLATRMRRNAESLVVLAGVETRRQWSRPVPVVDLIRGALGEVEDYERVQITALDEALVKGSTVADATHLVAELLENALAYSPPGRPVEIHGRAHPGGYALAITDHGVGMETDDLAVANTRVSGRESFTVAPSRYLGHYVVGIHADRLGLAVTLRDTPGGGTTAEIELGPVVAPAEAATGPQSAAPAPAAAAPAPEPPATPEPAAEGPAAATATDSTDEPVRAAPGDGAVTSEHAQVAMSPATTTGSGYTRRVRGANAPTTQVRTARTRAERTGPAGGAEAMRAALNSMQAGMQRSESETDEDGPDHPEAT